MREKNKKKTYLIIVQIIGILLLAAAGAGLYFHLAGRQKAQVPEDFRISQNLNTEITYNGKKYKYNSNLKNILFMGVDTKEEVTLKDTPGIAGQADCIMILSMDRESGETRILQISRDSMTDVDLYDINGNYYTSVYAQIATQYAYGNGKESSCWAMKKTVSELLHDLPIDAYISVNIDAIHIINDAVGGVTLTIPEDYTSIDPAFVKGETITLTGEQAEKYVRSRDTNERGSNNGRMRRQVQYIPELLRTVKQQMGISGDYYDRFYPLLSPYLVTDLSGDQINELAEYDLNEEEILYVPGEIQDGEKYEEYHVDEQALEELLISTFYQVSE
ncbi:MAG: LCP family protein [Lachnospiraceae bacterium]|nr:LCP family protein [Lachnospiraceae bacterium]